MADPLRPTAPDDTGEAGATLRQFDERATARLESLPGRTSGNVSLLHIHDQRTAPGGLVRFKSVLAHIQRRLDAAPFLRQRMVEVPLGLDRPYWADDPHFDLEYHVRHIALPKPGDWRQFCIQVSRIHARRLDFERPLWEVYVIEGLDSLLDLAPGSFALMFKTHVAAVEPAELGRLTGLLYDDRPDPPDAGPIPPWFPDNPPSPLGLLVRGLWGAPAQASHLAWQMLPWSVWPWRGGVRAVASHAALQIGQRVGQMAWQRMGRRAVQRLGRRVAPLLSDPTGWSERWLAEHATGGLDPAEAEVPVVDTRFNAEVSAHRVFESRRFDLAACETIAAAVPGATVEDVVLAACGGGLRQVLMADDELPTDGSLSAWLAGSTDALMPLSSAAPGAKASDADGRDWMRLTLATDQATPMKRLAAITADRQRIQARRDAAAQDDAASPDAAGLIGRAWQDAQRRLLSGPRDWARQAVAAIGAELASAQALVQPVPMPDGPLYLCGARLTYVSAMLPVRDGLALSVAVTRIDDRLIVSPTACRELMPDPEGFAVAMREEFEALLTAARRRRRAPRATPALPPKPRGARSPRPAGKAASRKSASRKSAARKSSARQTAASPSATGARKPRQTSVRKTATR